MSDVRLKLTRHTRRLGWGLALALVLLLVLSVAVYAGTSEYALSWNSIAGGGSTSAQGGGYVLSGTLGQPDAGIHSGGSYVISAGFWPGLPRLFPFYLPLLMKK